MAFVERKAGVIVGVYAVRQPGYAEEEIAEGHADVIAFRQGLEAPPPRDLAAELDALKAKVDRAGATEAVLIAKGTVTRAEIDAKVPDVVADLPAEGAAIKR